MTSMLHAVPVEVAPAWVPPWDPPVERRSPSTSAARGGTSWVPGPWFRLVLDAIDYGVALVQFDGSLLYANAAMNELLGNATVLRLDATGRLHAARPADELRLLEARHAACSRGLRRLVQLGEPAGTVALVGVDAARPDREQPCLLLASRAAPCERLSLELYAKLKGLTQAERQVLGLLAEGLSPDAIAQQQGVRISTVRTQVGSIRAKTEERSLLKLMQRLATLPPIAHALRRR